MDPAPIILHHYPQSPVSEKVRVVLGMKGLAWRSVEIPRLPPRPLLFPMTGGYRRTPVMQIGADVYCDSACINLTLERLHPAPTVVPPGHEATCAGLAEWAGAELFRSTVAIALGSQGDRLPPEFWADRGRLYFGPDFAQVDLAARLRHEIRQVRTQLEWVDAQLSDGRAFILGDSASLADASVYHLVWFLRGRYDDADTMLAGLDALAAWEARIVAIGHGEASGMAGEEALATCLAAEPSEAGDLAHDDAGTPGAPARVRPAGDGGDPWVEGTLAYANASGIALLHAGPEVGNVRVHFPRVGYELEMT